MLPVPYSYFIFFLPWPTLIKIFFASASSCNYLGEEYGPSLIPAEIATGFKTESRSHFLCNFLPCAGGYREAIEGWGAREAVVKLLLPNILACLAVRNALNHSQKQGKVGKMNFPSDVSVVCFLRKKLCRKKALHLMMLRICLFNLQLLYEWDFYFCSIILFQQSP